MPYDGRRTITVLFAFTIIIHNGSGVYRTSSSDSCKYCEHFFRAGLIPDTILKRATNLENSLGDDEGKNFIQKSSKEKMEMNFVDYCNFFCKNAFKISGSFNRERKLRRGTEMLGDKIPNKFHAKKKNRKSGSVESEKEPLKNPKQSTAAILMPDSPAAESDEKAVENFKTNREVEGDTEKSHRNKREASDEKSLRKFCGDVDAGNGYQDPTSEDLPLYNGYYNYKSKYNHGYEDYASQEEPEGVSYDEYSFDKGRQSNVVGDEDKLSIRMSGKSLREEYFSGEIAETPERRIWQIQEVRQSNEGKPCNCKKEFEKYMNALLKDAYVLMETALKQLSIWVRSSAQGGYGNLMKAHEGPKESRRKSVPTCDLSLGFTNVNNFFYPTEMGNKEPEIILAGDSHKVTETPFEKAAEIEDLSRERDEEEEPLITLHATKGAGEEGRGTTPEPEATTDFLPSNYVTFETAAKNMEIFGDATAAWTEPASEFTESSTVILRPEENNLTVTTRMKMEGITQMSPTTTEGNVIQQYEKTSKNGPLLCKMKNLEKPHFLPLILEALKHGRH